MTKEDLSIAVFSKDMKRDKICDLLNNFKDKDIRLVILKERETIPHFYQGKVSYNGAGYHFTASDGIVEQSIYELVDFLKSENYKIAEISILPQS